MKNKFLLFAILTTLVSVSKSYSQTNIIPQDTMVYCDQDSAIIQLSASYNLVAWEKLGSSGIILNNQLIVRESGFYQVAAADSTLGDTTVCFSTSDASMSALVNVPIGYIITDVIAGYYGTPTANCSNPLPGSCHFDATNIIKKGFVGKKSFQYYQGFHPDMCTGVVKSLYVKLRCMKYIQDSIYISLIKQPMNYTQISDTIICSNSNVSLTLPALICDTTFIPVDTLNLSVTSNNDVNSISTKSGRLYQIKVSNAVSYGGGSGNQADGAYTNITASPLENITWRINGMQFGTLTDFRPIPNGYNPSHEYYFYLIGNGGPFVFRANDCCLGDNSGQFQFVLSEVIINEQCNLNYIWSNGNIGNSATLTPSNIPYIVSLNNGSSICSIDTFYVTAQSSINSQPQNQSALISNSVLFTVASSDQNANFQWQTDLGVGFQNLNSVGQYSGTTNDTLTIANVTMSNNNQPFRCIISSGSCSDTSNVAVLSVNNNVSINETTQENLFSVFPNPAQSVINVKADSKLIGEVYAIYDNAGRVVLTGILNSQNTTIELHNLSGGFYLFSINENYKQSFRIIKE
jgi:hypothetical protein